MTVQKSVPRRTVLTVLLAVWTQAVACAQVPLREVAQEPLNEVKVPQFGQATQRKLHGRFLHVTDFHPDQDYTTYSSTEQGSACHRGEGPAGYYGAESSDCDSPISLVNATFDWLKEEVRDSIDFVLWTGDSARHDNDEKIPRSKSQVVGLNQLIAGKFAEVFGTTEDDEDPYNHFKIPIIPTFGNNDILPHNIFDVGPNTWTKTYLDLWRDFIPEEQRHQFDQGGWFSVEVIPNHLTVFSLNSLYFFDNNAAVDGCTVKSEPGYRQLEWLRIQLQFLRERRMKAMLIGHVPPAHTSGKHSWDETCWQKYTLWMRQYRDVIAGSFYGHMNFDHFMIQDFEDIDSDVNDGYGLPSVSGESESGDDITTFSAASYFTDMRQSWSKLPRKPRTLAKAATNESSELEYTVGSMSDDARPQWGVEALVKGGRGRKKKDSKAKERKYLKKIGGPHAERYSVSHVSPSVVPNFFPTIRIYEYNITGLDGRLGDRSDSAGLDESQPDYEIEKRHRKKSKQDKKEKKQRRKRRFTVPEPPSKSTPPGPAYSPQSLSLLGFTQYYANLTRINNDFAEANPRPASEVYPLTLDEQKWKEGKHNHHNGRKPREDSKPHPKKFSYEIAYRTRDDKTYNLKDLTVRSYLELAQRIGRNVKSSKNNIEDTEDDEEEDVSEEDSQGFDEDKTEDLEEEDVDAQKTGKKKHRKKQHHKKDRMNQVWLTFLRRAFVGAIPADELRDQFGP